jgi:hypothetical protein
MKKKVIIIVAFIFVALILLAFEVRKFDFGSGMSARDISASVIQQTEEREEITVEPENKDLTQESLESLNLGEVTIEEEGMTDLLLDEVIIRPLIARKQTIKVGETTFTANVIDNVKEYPVILTESYIQEVGGYKVSEIAKDAFIIESEQEKDKIRFVTEGKNTIIGLLFDAEDIDTMEKILKKHNFETP